MKAATCIIIVLFAIPCFAQESDLRGNLFGVAGITAVHTDESYFGSGVDVGGGIGYMVTRRFEVDFEIDHFSSDRDFTSGVRFEGDGFMAGGNARLYFGAGKGRPYIFGGLGIVHFNHKSFGLSPEIFESTDDSLSFQWGAGVRYFISPTVSIRPEFRWSFNDISFANQLRGSVAMAFHW